MLPRSREKFRFYLLLVYSFFQDRPPVPCFTLWPCQVWESCLLLAHFSPSTSWSTELWLAPYTAKAEHCLYLFSCQFNPCCSHHFQGTAYSCTQDKWQKTVLSHTWIKKVNLSCCYFYVLTCLPQYQSAFLATSHSKLEPSFLILVSPFVAETLKKFLETNQFHPRKKKKKKQRAACSCLCFCFEKDCLFNVMVAKVE